jgi:hypothetical protein
MPIHACFNVSPTTKLSDRERKNLDDPFQEKGCN